MTHLLPMPHTLSGAAVALALAFASIASLADDLALVLVQGAQVDGVDGPVGGDLFLDLPWDGNAPGDGWGFAPALNRAHHSVRVVSARASGSTLALELEVALASDPLAPGGTARYTVDLERRAPHGQGSWKGVVLDRTRDGEVRGRLAPGVVRHLPGHRPLAPQEHPRLALRAADLPALRTFLTTPQGAAILEMATTRAPVRRLDQVDDRRTSWIAANHAALHLLTGSPDEAETALRVAMDQVVRMPLPGDRLEIHHAMRLVGLALAYDMAAPAWDEVTRLALARNLLAAAVELHHGRVSGEPLPGLNTSPWSHRGAIRSAAVGLVALAVKGDLNEEANATADSLVRASERAMIVWLREGVGSSGYAHEGPFFKSLVLANGGLAFLRGLAVAEGRDLSAASPFLLSGHLLKSPLPAAGEPLEVGLSSISVQTSGRWALGLGFVPEDHFPLLRWGFDRGPGSHGRAHYDCAWPWQVPFLLGAIAAHEAGATPTVPPATPRSIVPDPVAGHHVARNRFRDSEDVLVVAHVRVDPPTQVDLEQAEEPLSLRLVGLGAAWIDGPLGVAPRNRLRGAATLYADAPSDGVLVAGATLDPLYLQAAAILPPRRQRGAGPDGYLVNPILTPAPDPYARAVTYTESGIRGERHVLVDVSGASGAEAVVIVADRMEGAARLPWRIPLPEGVTWSRGEAEAGSPDGPRLHVKVIHPAQPRAIRGALTGSDAYLVVWLLSAAPPPIQVDGEGVNATLKIGARSYRLEGERFVVVP